MQTIGLTIVALLVSYLVYVIGFMVLHAHKTGGGAYFSMPLEQRREVKAKLKRQLPFIMPFFRFVGRFFQLKTMPAIYYKGVPGPKGMSTEASHKAAEEYPAGSEDIFVATQMKCGTTWMQQIVFEILHKGQGDLSDDGYRTMYGLSPWIETDPRGAVSMESAPLVSEYKKRIIKTHLPTDICPYSSEAKYIYVTRHPVSCFVSTADFLTFLTSPMTPTRENLLDWYCSEDFYDFSWATNLKGWWQWSQQYDNVHFVHYEDLKAEPRDMIAQVAEFLGVELTPDELDTVVEKTGFQYMKEREEHFEMSVPSVFTMNNEGGFLRRGTQQRHKDANEEERERINRYMVDKLKDSDYPLAKHYPDVVGS